ncbi:hypothetical protein APICC_10159 [Apis cerana cerana]|uniref:Uncharacterized protein n=2 Tax=Apis cerana TaxID=7461 RepID=A0A2A3ETJ8_APICC|nr:hypothetical protein APICC_10159 [Apis cerana cerana]
METFMIIGICFLCYEMCDLIRRYATPQTAEPRRSFQASTRTQNIFSISHRMQSRPAYCPQ